MTPHHEDQSTVTDRRAVHLHIRGKVQGVFFRQSALARAVELKLSGWVRNLRDGRVEAFAEGPSDRVDAFVAWCRKGPPSAHVEEVVAEAASPDPSLGDFTVEPTR